MLDVLLYLFHHYLHPEMVEDLQEGKMDTEHLTLELKEAGFDPAEIDQAFRWLEGILSLQHDALPKLNLQPASIRCYAEDELNKLTLKSRGFLLNLEQSGLLDKETRELVIDRAMALDIEKIHLEAMKWVVFMVLLNQLQTTEATKETVSWLENVILEPMEHAIH